MPLLPLLLPLVPSPFVVAAAAVAEAAAAVAAAAEAVKALRNGSRRLATTAASKRRAVSSTSTYVHGKTTRERENCASFKQLSFERFFFLVVAPQLISLYLFCYFVALFMYKVNKKNAPLGRSLGPRHPPTTNPARS